MVKLYFAVILIFAAGCKQHNGYKRTGKELLSSNAPTRIFSKSVNDSFSIYVSVPEDYHIADTSYPVVYILDANLYFDICSVIMKKYAEVGLVTPAIVVGIGYKDFPAMDSLRNRDYTYPLAIPEYEMTTSGKADKFFSFLTSELIPFVEKSYPVNKYNRILMGHSLGGYFTLYALQQSLLKPSGLFNGYIAASPSTHYNNYYLLHELRKMQRQNMHNVKAYISSGGLEEGTDNDTAMFSTTKVFSSLDTSLRINAGIQYKAEVYSNLDHMDTPLPTFVKGLQWILNKE
jgi:uncharacterized protein